MRYVFFLSVLAIWLVPTFAQTDSSKYLLREIVVCTENQGQQFDYYRSSRLSTTEDIMSRMQGVNMIRRGAYGFEPTIRNYSANQITMSIGGMRMYGACTDRMDPVSIYVEPSNLHSLSVQHGNSGMAMGSSIGGNINLGLKMPDRFCHPGSSVQFNQLYQTNNNGYAGTLALEHQTGKLGIRGTFTYRKAGNYTDGKDSVVKHSYFEKLNTSLALAYELDSNNQLQLHYLYDEGRDIGYPALPMDVGIATAHMISAAHLLKTKKWQAENKLYYNTIYHSMDDTQRDSVPMHMDMPGWSETIGGFSEWTRFGERNHWKFRADAHENYLRADMTMYPNNGDPSMYMQTLPASYLLNTGLFVQWQYLLTKKQSLQLNGRIDWFKQFASEGIGSDQALGMGYDIHTPQKNILKNVGATYCLEPNLHHNFTLNIGYAERLPSANERYGFYLFNRMDGYDYIGNPNLEIESSKQVELKYTYTQKQWTAFLQVYYHLQNNYIYPYLLKDYYAMTIGAKGVKTYKSIDVANSTGIEYGLQWRFWEHWQFNQTGRYIYSRTNWGEPLPWVSPLTFYNSLRYKKASWQAQIDYEYHAAQNQINRDFNERSTPAYQLLHLRAAKLFYAGKHAFQATIACENIFNAVYHDHLDVGYVPRMGRNFQIGLNYTY